MAAHALRGLALCAGVGGLERGLALALGDAYRPVCAVEVEAFAAVVLVARQQDGSLPPFPIWDSLLTFDGRPWRGVVDLVSAGFPCQDISLAGKRAGIREGNRNGLWFEVARVIGEVGPRYVFLENVRALAVRGLDIVLGTLADLGFDAEWGVYSAAEIGAPHKRERLFILAHAAGSGDAAVAGSLHGDARANGALVGIERQGGGRDVAHAGRDAGAGRGAAGDVAGASRDAEGEGIQRQRLRNAALDGRADVGIRGVEHASDAGLEGGREGLPVNGRGAMANPGRVLAAAGHEQGRSGAAETAKYQGHHRSPNGRDPLAPFPPRPDDRDAWADILGRRPDLAPAVESPVRGVADGLAPGLDVYLCPRTDQLRAIGNGVVPQTAALAFRELWERLHDD